MITHNKEKEDYEDKITTLNNKIRSLKKKLVKYKTPDKTPDKNPTHSM